MQALEELESALSGLAHRVGPAIVGVGAGWGGGSGFVVAQGRVLTNAHNLRGRETTVVFSDGREAVARLAGADVGADLAVLEVETGDAPPVTWAAEPDRARTGTAVIALANPGGRGLHATFGFVSATKQAFRGPEGRIITGAVAHTAPLVSGSSGGPIVDPSGAVLAVNTHRIGDGFYLAVPATEDLRNRIEALSRGETPARLRLGLAIAPPRAARHLRRAVGLPDRDGLLVRGVTEDSPADRAGLRRGDLLVEAAGRELTSPDELFEVLDGLGAGSTLALTVVRGTEELAVAVTFSESREEGSV